MRVVEIKLPHKDMDALRAFVRFHTNGTNILIREWVNGKEEIEYVFVEVNHDQRR